MLGIHKISKKQMLRPNAKLLKLRARAQPERAAGSGNPGGRCGKREEGVGRQRVADNRPWAVRCIVSALKRQERRQPAQARNQICSAHIIPVFCVPSLPPLHPPSLCCSPSAHSLPFPLALWQPLAFGTTKFSINSLKRVH